MFFDIDFNTSMIIPVYIISLNAGFSCRGTHFPLSFFHPSNEKQCTLEKYNKSIHKYNSYFH